MVKIRFASGPCSLQYKAERLGWSAPLLLQTEAALIADRKQIDYRYVPLYDPTSKTRAIPLTYCQAAMSDSTLFCFMS